ncbi:MAG: YbjN domain-containing protein [Propionibacteriaceae bacterium]|nr:YbjN domain-containing protein [Propionibacteriaceae bacterium]
MGYFTKPGSNTNSDLAPLSTGRVSACLDSHNWHYEVSDDGDIGGWWDGFWFVFSFRGKNREILFAHAVWSRGVPSTEFTAAALHANEWNAEHLWPMLSVREREGVIAVLADFSMDYSYGLTDEQLDLHIKYAIDTIVSALSWMDGKYPDYVESNQ